MQFNPVYLYSNKVDVFTNLDSWTTERYRKVYQRNFKIYRGVENRLDLQVRNSDEKSKDISGYTLIFNLIERDTQKLILSKECSVVSNVNGKVRVALTEEELNIIDKGFYDFSVHAVDINNKKIPLYVDSQYGGLGAIEVFGDVFGEPKESTVVDTFSIIPKNWPTEGYSDSEFVYASPTVSSTATIHTFSIYQTNFFGIIEVQASSDTHSAPSKWTTVLNLEYPIIPNTVDTQTRYFTTQGKWNWFRIIYTPDRDNEGTVDKVLYR